MIGQGIEQFGRKRILLLQGPIGPFFKHLAADLRTVGATTFKINFNGGDCFFYARGATSYRGRMEHWPAFLEHYLEQHRIDTILLFGDCRPVHVAARAISATRNISIGVFEEGYVRPDYITFEGAGVNAHSTLPRDAGFYQALTIDAAPDAQPVGRPFGRAARLGIAYYIASILTHPLFRHYQHHRRLNAAEGFCWAQAYWRKKYYARKERGLQSLLSSAQHKRYFLVPLQVGTDAQVRNHSHYRSIEAFIRETVASFALHAPQETLLAIKHHPMDRGHHDYSRLIARLADKHQLHGRLLYLHDQHLPTLLEHARGAVTINSTVGLSALHHSTPTKICGQALYDIRGLTYQGTLDSFWNAAATETVDRVLYCNFVAYLVLQTQLNGNFYQRLPKAALQCGILWPQKVLAHAHDDLARAG